MGRQQLVFSVKTEKVSLPLSQHAPEGDVNLPYQNVMPDEQGLGLPSIYLGGRFNQISLSAFAYANRTSDW